MRWHEMGPKSGDRGMDNMLTKRMQKLNDEQLEVLYQGALSLYLLYRRERTRRSKIKNAYASLAKAKANGSKMGRKRLRDDKLIRKLRKAGLTIRAIAKKAKTSTTSVQKSLQEVLE